MTPERYEQISEIFGQAAELPRGERLEFVKCSCGDDAELEREVFSLLDHDQPDEGSITQIPDVDGDAQKPRLISWRRKSRDRKNGLALASAIAACALAAIGFTVYYLVDNIQKTQLKEKLSTVLDADVAATKLWIEFVIKTTERWAGHPGIIETAQRVNTLKQDGAETVEILASEINQNFLEIVTTARELPAVRGVHLVSLEQGLLASTPVEGIMQDVKLKPKSVALFARALDGETVFSPPYMEHSRVENLEATERVPIVGVVSPVIGETGKPFAVFSIRWRVDEDFARILSIARLGETGETYAFDKAGVVVSSLRQEDRLRELGVIAKDAPSGSALNVSLRDPGGDLAGGYSQNAPRETLPLTRMAAQATAGVSGIDIKGYRDFCGRDVVGAWRWLDEFGIGVAAEISYEEAYAASNSVRNIFAGLFVVLIATAIFGLASERIAFRLRSELENIRDVGPYEIEGTVASGGMGTVYLASHRLLKRPVAIKVIREDRIGAKAIKRFEREVRAMSRLTQPHTVQIFDFGVQQDGALYFAMEYLDGISLQELIKRHGALRWERAVYLLKQVCSSLIEAHEAGLIHRDIKPQNIMVCCFGNEGDFVKVLDFGLVIDAENGDASISSTSDGKFSGTPLYMAPERMRNPSAATTGGDIYSLGAVAYNLLTGEPAFRGVNALDTCFRAMTEAPPEIPNALDVPEKLSRLVTQSLAADPDERPSTIAEILEILEELPISDGWDRARAEAWWCDFQSRVSEDSGSSSVMNWISENGRESWHPLGGRR